MKPIRNLLLIVITSSLLLSSCSPSISLSSSNSESNENSSNIDSNESSGNVESTYPEESTDYSSVHYSSGTSVENPLTQEEIQAIKPLIVSIVKEDLFTEYDVFDAYVKDPNSDIVSNGIGFSDYSNGYIDEEAKIYLSCGFVSFDNSEVLEDIAEEEGLEVFEVGKEDNQKTISFIYDQYINGINRHFVSNRQYVKYDIVDGVLSIQSEMFYEGMEIDESRGNVYDYDNDKYVYFIEPTDYIHVKGISLVDNTDYQNVINKINKSIDEQNVNFTYEEIETYIYHAKEAMLSYLLLLQEEEFCGVKVTTLIETARNLDLRDHLRIEIDEEGNVSYKIIHITKLASLTEKILASVTLGLAIITAAVAAVPTGGLGTAAIIGMVTGVAMEYFDTAVINGVSFDEMRIIDIAWAALSGALSGAASFGMDRLLGEASQKLSQKVIRIGAKMLEKTIVDATTSIGKGLVIDNESFDTAIKKYGQNFATGLLLDAVCNTAVEVYSSSYAHSILQAARKGKSKVNGKVLYEIQEKLAKESKIKKDILYYIENMFS